MSFGTISIYGTRGDVEAQWAAPREGPTGTVGAHGADTGFANGSFDSTPMLPRAHPVPETNDFTGRDFIEMDPPLYAWPKFCNGPALGACQNDLPTHSGLFNFEPLALLDSGTIAEEVPFELYPQSGEVNQNVIFSSTIGPFSPLQLLPQEMSRSSVSPPSCAGSAWASPCPSLMSDSSSISEPSSIMIPRPSVDDDKTLSRMEWKTPLKKPAKKRGRKSSPLGGTRAKKKKRVCPEKARAEVVPGTSDDGLLLKNGTCNDPVRETAEDPDLPVQTAEREADRNEDDPVSEDEADCSRSREVTPWPESWYRDGIQMGLAKFTARHMAELSREEDAVYQDGDTTGPQTIRNFHAQSSHSQTSGSEKPQSQANGNSGAGQPSSQQSRQSTGGPGNSSTPLGSQGGSNDDPNEDPKRLLVPGQASWTAGSGPFFACPYQKRCPNDSPMCGLPYGKRKSHGYSSTSRVKQHLLESHGRDHHCLNCWNAYKTVVDARGCQAKRKCVRRSSPSKMWLKDDEIRQLKAARFPACEDSWYRIYSILFPDDQELGPNGFRKKYTPYYSKVENPPTPSSSSGTSPNSIWTPCSNNTQSSELPLTDTLNGESPNDGGNVAGASGDKDDGRLASLEQECLERDMLPDIDVALSEDINHEFGLDTYTFTNFSAPSIAADTRSISTCVIQPSSTDLGSSQGGASETGSDCPSCTPPVKCSACRARTRNRNLRTENAAWRAIVGKMRTAWEQHHEILENINGGETLSNDALEKLWLYQDEMGILLKTQV